jgi:beta-galactosidase
MTEHHVQVREGELRVDGRARPVAAAAMHYWRVEREHWERVLDAIVDAGATAVSLYVPWEAHETARGEFDFGGGDPRLDLDGLLTLIEARSLDVVARPGPQINAEMDWFGYPRRILADRGLHALNNKGTSTVLTQVPKPIPALSYAEDCFFDEVALWYDAVLPILRRHPRLLVVQVDNEMAFFFGVNVWCADYAPASVANYRRFLARKLGDIATLNDQYDTSWSSFDEVEPPRRFEGTGPRDIPRLADWAEYRERYLVDCLDRLATMMRERGIDVPLFHNYPHPLNPGSSASGFTTPFNLPALEGRLDFAGFDIYSRKQMYDHVKTVVSYVVGSSRWPYAPELMAGAWPWYLQPGDVADEEFVAKAALMHGLRGFSRYVLVERDRWMASPIRRDGRVRDDKLDVFRRVDEIVTGQDVAHLRRRADVLLLADRDYDRLAATSVLVSFPGDFLETPTTFSEYPNEMTLSDESLGLAEPAYRASGEFFSACYDGLTTTGHAFVLSDTGPVADGGGSEVWAGRRAVVMPSVEYLDAEVQRTAVMFARGGGTVVLGPRLPGFDARLQPDTTLVDALGSAGEPVLVDAAEVGRFFAVGDGAIVHLDSFTDPRVLDAALADSGVLRPIIDDTRADVAVHRGVDDPRRHLVYVANPTPEPITTRVVPVPDAEVGDVREVWHDKKHDASGGGWQVRLGAHDIAIYACTVDEQETR